MKRFVILIPYGVRTGGPEALHQLCDALLRQGHDARVWYVLPTDLEMLAGMAQSGGLGRDSMLRLPPRPNTVADYARYRVELAQDIVLDGDTCIVLAETYVHWLRFFQHCRTLVWWLSVDNAFEYLAVQKTNLNSLRSERVLHGYQSGYARDFVRALGCTRTLPLSDYTPDAEAGDDAPAPPKTDIAINANHKVIYDAAGIAERLQALCGTRVHLIRGLSRAQVYECLQRSMLFIDLGNFPGKDRLAREALLRNCCVFVLDVGAARDYGLPEECYFKPDEVDQVFGAAQELLRRYEFYLRLQQGAREAVLRERLVFDREVAGVARAFGA